MASQNKPQQCELVENIWCVENYKQSKDVVQVPMTLPQHSVRLVNCADTVITINSKIKFASIIQCEKVSVIFDKVITLVEVVNCNKLKIQVLQNVPSISIDKSQEVSLYVSHEGKDVEITSSLSEDMNINFPKEEKADSEWIEVAIPQQFQHRLVNDKLVTRVSDLYSC